MTLHTHLYPTHHTLQQQHPCSRITTKPMRRISRPASCSFLLLLVAATILSIALLSTIHVAADTNGTIINPPVTSNTSTSNTTTPTPPTTSSSSLAKQFGEGVAAWIGFLFIAIASSQCALIVRYARLPLITGYMFFGLLVGPQILEMVSKADIGYLQPVTQFALAFISLSAGAELYLPELRALFRRILTITGAVTVICFIVCLLVIWGLAAIGLIPFMSDLSGSCQFSISLIAASIMVTQSPASAIAVVAETKAKGPFTSTFLGITVLTDIVVLLLYSVCASVANASCSAEGGGFKVIDLGVTIGCILSALFLGYLFGKLIIFLIWIPRMPGEWLVLPLGYATFKVSSWFTEFSTEEYGHGINFDPLLICIVAGYIVANQSRNRRKFLRFLGKVGPVIFIPFFTLTGAGLNLKVMFQSLPFAAIVFTVRALTFGGGTVFGGHYTGMSKMHLKWLWLSMLTQAGVSLGIAAEVAIAFPDWGTEFQSTMISVILINQVVGPILCKMAIKSNGEDGQAQGMDEEDDEEHVKRCMIIGVNISSLAVAQRLLKLDWNVLFIDTDLGKTDMLQWLQYEKRKKKEKTPAQLAKAAALKKAKEEEAKANTFIDLNPPGSPESSAVSSEGSINPTDPDANPFETSLAVPAEPSRAGDELYAPVSPMDPSASGVAPLSYPSSSTLEVSSSASDPSAIHLGIQDSMNNTTTPPEDQQVQFRLLTAEDLSSADSSASKLTYPREAAGLKKICWDLNPHNIEAAVVMLDMDQLNFDLCTVLQESLHLPRVIVEIQNPNWTSMFVSMGIQTIFPYSLTSHTLVQMITKHESENLEIVSDPNKPLQVSLGHIIRPDTITYEKTGNVPLYLRHLTQADQETFAAQHPDPPMPREAMWKFDERVKVVSSAQRDEYLSQIHSLHSNNVVKLDHRGAANAAEYTFSGPGMLSMTGGDETGDENDPEFIAYREAKRAAKEARSRARRQSMQKMMEEGDI